MLAIGTVEPQEFENTIICQEVQEDKPKVKGVKKTVSKKPKPVEEVEEVEEVIEQVVEPVEEVIEQVAEQVEEVIEQVVEPVEEVQPSTCDILEYLQRIENHLKKIDDFYTKLEFSHIDCDITNEVKSIGERLNKIEELHETADKKDNSFIVWTQNQYFTNRVIDEIKRMGHPIFKGIDEEEEVIEQVVEPVEEIIETVEEVIEQVVEPVEEIIEPVVAIVKTISHKEIQGPRPKWLEYIPTDETYSTSILTYVKDNLKIDKRIMEHLKVRFMYLNELCNFQIFASDDINDKFPISFCQCNTREEHYNGNTDAFRIYLDPCIEFKADFLRKKKYLNFNKRQLSKVVKPEDVGGEIFFKLEKEILQYSKMITEEKKKVQCMMSVVKEQPRKKNYMKLLPTEILDIIYEYARDDTHKNNFLNSYIPLFKIIHTPKFSITGVDILECIQQNEDRMFQIFYKKKDTKNIQTSFVFPYTLFHGSIKKPKKRYVEIKYYKSDITKVVSHIKNFEYVYNSELTAKVFLDLHLRCVVIRGFRRTKKGTPTKNVAYISHYGRISWYDTKNETLENDCISDEVISQMNILSDELYIRWIMCDY